MLTYGELRREMLSIPSTEFFSTTDLYIRFEKNADRRLILQVLDDLYDEGLIVFDIYDHDKHKYAFRVAC